MKNIVFVGGTFDVNGGKSSGVIRKLYHGFSEIDCGGSQSDVFFMNGGTLADLALAKHHADEAQIVVWLANVPNTEPKDPLRSIKVLNPTCVLVTSKRSIERQYTIPEIVQHALALHSNLVVVFDQHPESALPFNVKVRVLDPLGNTFASTYALHSAGRALGLRTKYLSRLTRLRSVKAMGSCPEEGSPEPVFLDIVRRSAEKFATLLPSPVPVTRFVGNAAFRCSFGFPAVKGKEEVIYVSRRNVDKTIATIADFVPVLASKSAGNVVYCGNHKPSVDTALQLRLFAVYPKIRYILHGHVYINGESYTHDVLPCGSMTEATEVWSAFPDYDTSTFRLNLKGHGFIAGSTDPAFFETLLPRYEARPMPEDQSDWTHRVSIEYDEASAREDI